ncbi:MAG: lamin tail domain-containing protein [Alphaproteobacteria bacterium]|nr:lamin tail domain-containing protein [Alphaproteobacteria bacterium]
MNRPEWWACAAVLALAGCKDGGNGDWTAPDVVINELVASNATGLQDESGAFPDWLELYNDGDELVDLSTYTITDDPIEPQKSLFPAGTTIEAGGFLIVFVDGDPSTPNEVHTTFRLSRVGETVQLVGPATEDFPIVSEVTYPLMETDTSWALIGSGYEVATTPTPGAPNE